MRANEKADAVNIGSNHNKLAGGKFNGYNAFNYTKKVNFYQSLTVSQSERKHAVLDWLLYLQENRQIVFRGKKIKSIISAPDRVNNPIFLEMERSILEDAEYLHDAEILQDVPYALYSELKRRGEDELIRRLPERRVVAIPGEITNALICEELRKRFSDEDFELCGVFVKLRDFVNGKTCEVFRIDIEKHLARRGFFIPIEDEKGLITGLKVYRHIDDERPFKLRARCDVIDYSGGKYELA